MPEEELRKVIKYFGSQQKLAGLLRINRSLVNHWLNSRLKISLKYALQIEVITKGLVKAECLNPDAKLQLRMYEEYIQGIK